MTATITSYLPPACPWLPDQGDGSYVNPVLHADFSDPDVIRVGDDYWMVASSFSCLPGLPILHSRDLVNWELTGYALTAFPEPGYELPRTGGGVWAPALREHDGTFFIYFPLVDEGIYVVTARDMRGPWTPARQVIAGKGLIDPCPYWDDDGRAYLAHAYARSRSGVAHKLRIRPMAVDGLSVLGEGWLIYDGTGCDPYIEGPKIYKRDGWYYVFAPAGGVPSGWQVVFRSRSLCGPWERKVVLAQNDSPVNGPHQGALVDTPSGEWWFLHFSDAGPYGRVVHLQPAGWQDGWPTLGVDADGSGIGTPVLRHRKPALPPQPRLALATDDDFTGATLALPWQWSAAWSPSWFSLTARPGWLRLNAVAVPRADLTVAPNLLLQKWPARAFTAVSSVDDAALLPGARAGMVIMCRRFTTLTVEVLAGVRSVVWRIAGDIIGRRTIAEGPVRLRVDVSENAYAVFAFAQGDGPWQFLNDMPAHRPEGGDFMGAKVGLGVIAPDGQGGGSADFGPWRIVPLRRC